MAKKAAAAKSAINKALKPSQKEFPLGINAGCEKVWNGSIGRLRVYDQPGSTGKKVFAYLEPGANANYVGWSDDKNVVRALFLARDNSRGIMGYTNENCRIEWLDY
jgi:hypothetical protein